MKTMPVFCGRDCGGDACPLVADLEDGRVLRVRHNPAAGSYLRGCPKGFALPHFHYSPQRIRTPLLRTGPRGSGQFRPISWDEALDRVRDGLADCRERRGLNSILCLSSAGSTGALHNTDTLTRRFLNATGGCTVLDGSYSSNAAGFALRQVFGQDFGRSGFDAATMDRSRLVILWGANILEARLGAELPARLREAGRRGVPILSIDPRRTGTAEKVGAKWIPLRPGTDCALMYSILHVLGEEGHIDLDYADSRAEGFREILEHAAGKRDGIVKDPAWAGAVCGVDPDVITRLARMWASVKPAMLIPGYSIQRTEYGEEAARLCVALQLATKNFGVAGGSTGSLNNRLPGPRVGKLGEGDGSGDAHVPILRWADAILEGKPSYPSSIHAVYSAGGNLLNQGADIAKNIRAFESLDFAVSHELFLTPTAKYCDVVLPASSPLQKEDIGLPWSGNYLLYKPRLLPSEGQERSDYEIFRDLASRFGVEERFSEGRNEEEWIRRFIEDSEIGDPVAFMENGIYFGHDQERPGLAEFAADPGGHGLKTASGKLELGRGRRWAADRAPADDLAHPPLLLITPKVAERVHSQGGDHPEAILLNSLSMNGADASALGLEEGEIVLVVSGTGRTRATISLSDEIKEGVVSLPEGSWCAGPQLEGSQPTDTLFGSANWLTSTKGTEESTSCVMHGLAVEIHKIRP